MSIKMSSEYWIPVAKSDKWKMFIWGFHLSMNVPMDSEFIVQ